MDVRVDGGPQDGTILVTWIPVPHNTGQVNRLAPVTGYAVFADGKRVTDVDSPSSTTIFNRKVLKLLHHCIFLQVITPSSTSAASATSTPS